MTSILIIHFHSSKNAGDAAQLEATIADLRENFGEAEITVAANYPREVYLERLSANIVPSVSALIGVGQRPIPHAMIKFMGAFLRIISDHFLGAGRDSITSKLTEWTTTLHAYRSADIVISSAGNIFFTLGSFGFPFLCSALALLPAFLHRKPVYIYPQTLGPLDRWWERSLLRGLYSRARMIFLRDRRSYQLAEELGIPDKKLYLTVDQSFHLKIDKHTTPPQVLFDLEFISDEGSIGVTPIPRLIKSISPKTLNEYFLALATSLSEFAGIKGLKVYFFPQVTGPQAHEDDRWAAEQVASRMTLSKDRIILIKDSLTPTELIQSYRWMDLLIATRLHSGIFAFLGNTPVLLLAYLDKSMALAEMLAWEEYCLPIASITSEQISTKLNEIWKNREVLRNKISPLISSHLAKSIQVGHEIRKDFENVC